MFPPEPHEFPQAPYVAEYLGFETQEPLNVILQTQAESLLALYHSLDSKQWDWAYAPEKWSMKEVLGHLVDTERVFAYRSLCIARGETQSLPGYDENAYQLHAQYQLQSPQQVLEQYQCQRKASLALFNSYHPKQWDRKGTANGQSLSARALAWMIAGHERHHFRVIQEKYLPLLPKIS